MSVLSKVVVYYLVLVNLLAYRLNSRGSVPSRTSISGQGWLWSLHLEPGLKFMELYLQPMLLPLLRRQF